MPDSTGNDDYLALHITAQRAIHKQIGVEITQPVIPQLVRIAGQLGHFDTTAFQRPFGFAVVVTGFPHHICQTFRYAQTIGNGGDNAFNRR